MRRGKGTTGGYRRALALLGAALFAVAMVAGGCTQSNQGGSSPAHRHQAQSGNGSSLKVVRDAYTTTENARSARVSITETISRLPLVPPSARSSSAPPAGQTVDLTKMMARFDKVTSAATGSVPGSV